MNRYIRGIGCIIIGSIKSLMIKAERGSKARLSFPVLIASGTEVSVDKGGELSVGKNLSMRRGCRLNVRSHAKVIIGDHLYMNTNCMISAHDCITIGDNVEFGPGVLVYDQDHDFRVEGGITAKKFKVSPVTIGNNVWVGANSIILRGTNIGDNCVIAAGSIIKGSFPANSVIVQKRKTEVIDISK